MPISRIFSEPLELWPCVIGIFVLLIVANFAAWTCSLLLFYDQPVLLGTALLAYGFGLRHAVDADHIAAIDNVVRKLMQSEERPVYAGYAGFFFALGHSTVDVVAVAVAVTPSALLGFADTLKSVGGLSARWSRPFSCSRLQRQTSSSFMESGAHSGTSVGAAPMRVRISISYSTAAASSPGFSGRCFG